MMRTTVRAGACAVVLLSAHVATGAEQPDTEPTSERPTTVREVTIDTRAPVADCRKVAPTGSRIATRRCTTERQASTPLTRAEDLQRRRDLEQMRSTQVLQEQAREQAKAEAMRRRAMGL